MIRRLVEADYFTHRGKAGAKQIGFWLREARSPEILIELKREFPAKFAQEAKKRGLLRAVGKKPVQVLEKLLRREEDHERRKDRAYWRPLRRELELLRWTQAVLPPLECLISRRGFSIGNGTFSRWIR